MAAIVIRQPGQVSLEQLPVPVPGAHDVLLQVGACGGCRTDLHILDAELAPHKKGVVPGHEVVGRVVARGPLGIYGFGAAAHILTQLAVRLGRTVFAFTRPGDAQAQQFARGLGAAWAGASGDLAPERLHSAIIFAPAGELVPYALACSAKGAAIVCAGIHMSDIPAFPYRLLWGERCVRSVANLTRKDGEAFLRLADLHRLETVPVRFSLQRAAVALEQLRNGSIEGAAVLVPPSALTDVRGGRTAPGQACLDPPPAPD